MPTALITGLGGFTGKYLAAELEMAGYNVYGTVYGENAIGERTFAVDLCNGDAVRELVTKVSPEIVVNLAAISFVAHGDVAEIYNTNVIGARNLLEALVDCDVDPSAVLLVSSANIYGNASVDPIDESAEFKPANDYAVSKLAMEYMARLWMDKLPVTIARPFNYTGVGQSLSFLLPKIVDHFKRGAREIELGNLDVERDFSDVRSVVKSYSRLLEVAPAGEAFNVCSGHVHSLGDVLDMMAGIAGYKINVKVNPEFVRDNEVRRLRGSNNKLARLVGGIEYVPLIKTLRWMYESACPSGT